LTGSLGISNDLEVKGNISSSTVSGIGNVTLYSQSVDARLDILEATASLFVPFSQSVEQQLTSLENFTSSTFVNFSQSVDARLDVVEATASLYIPFSQSVDLRLDSLELTASYLDGPFSTSVDARLDSLEAFSSSLQADFATQAELTQTASFLQNQINQKVFTSSFNTFTASFNSYTQSTNVRLDSLEVASSSLQSFTSSANVRLSNLETTTASLNSSVTQLNASSASQQISINALNAVSASLAVTGSNTFSGSQIISGSLRGNVINLSVVSQTASMDLSLSNFFILTLPTGSTTRLNVSNIQPGQTTQLLIKQQSTTGSITYPNNILFATGSDYSASIFANSQDILSFASFDTSSIYAVSVKNLV
jgi:hypothetical protein